jgi:hypothetical protein
MTEKEGVMQMFKGVSVIAAVVPLVAALNGCSNALIDARIGAERVKVVDASQVTNCESKGKVTINVLSKVGFIDRSADVVEGNLVKMARNSAVDADANTIVKGERADIGTQTFSMYKCPVQ